MRGYCGDGIVVLTGKRACFAVHAAACLHLCVYREKGHGKLRVVSGDLLILQQLSHVTERVVSPPVIAITV